MRVALNAAFWGSPGTGSGQYLRRLVPALAEARSPEDRFFLVGIEEARETLPPGVECQAAQPVVGRLGRNLDKLWFEQVSFPREARRWGAHLAHVPYFAPALLPRLPLVVTIHDLIPLLFPEYRAGLGVRAYMALASTAARRADHIIADSVATQRDIVRLLGIPEGRISVVYLAAGQEFQPTAQREDSEIRERYRLQGPYILYLGGFDRRKNLAGLLRAYALARARHEFPHRLAIAGRLPSRLSPLFPDYRRMVGELALEGEALFLGWVAEEDKPALYRGASLFVYPSLYEGFALPVLEAMACGTPVVASDRSSLPEVVGEGGLLVEPEDVEGLATAIYRAATDESLCRELSRKGPQRAKLFSWKKAAEETIAVYRRVLG